MQPQLRRLDSRQGDSKVFEWYHKNKLLGNQDLRSQYARKRRNLLPLNKHMWSRCSLAIYFIYDLISSNTVVPLLEHPPITLLDNQLEFRLKLGIEIMLWLLAQCQYHTSPVLTGFWATLAVYWATSSLIILLGMPLAAAASAISWDWQAFSKKE